MIKKIKIGCRGSKLSLAYANKVKNLILTNDKKKILRAEIVTIKTSGDRNKNKKISEIGGKNLFCKEIENKLIQKKINIAVHSLKDLDSIETKGLSIQAFIKRNDPRDCFLSKNFKNFSKLKKNIVGSSSKRRELQSKLFNRNILIKEMRGNIDTRIKKIKSGQFDGIILALAGVKTLQYDSYVKEIFPTKFFLPCAGQGIIAVQSRTKDRKIKELLNKINHKNTQICAIAERSFLKNIGGDCDTAVGCYAKLSKNRIKLEVQLFSDDEKKFFELKRIGNKNKPKKLGKDVAKEILKISKGNFIKKR